MVYICVCVLSCFSFVQLFAILWTIPCQMTLSLGFSRKECWSGLPCLPPGDLPDPDIKPVSPALQVDSLPLSHWRSPVFLCECPIIVETWPVSGSIRILRCVMKLLQG